MFRKKHLFSVKKIRKWYIIILLAYKIKINTIFANKLNVIHWFSWSHIITANQLFPNITRKFVIKSLLYVFRRTSSYVSTLLESLMLRMINNPPIRVWECLLDSNNTFMKEIHHYECKWKLVTKKESFTLSHKRIFRIYSRKCLPA